MEKMLFDSADIVPEAKRRSRSRSRSRSSGGFFGAIGSFFRGIFTSAIVIVLLIIVLIMLPFILLRNRRAGNNDAFIDDSQNKQSFNDRQSFNDIRRVRRDIDIMSKK